MPVALVTGAGRGIGLAIAQALAEAGAALCLCGRSAEPLDAAARLLPRGTRVLTVPADVSQSADVRRVVERCRAELGPVDWLVNNAGVVERAPLAELTEAQWDHVVDVNLKGPFLCTQAALPDLLARQGRVVNIGSISGTLGSARNSPYNASKWGVNGLTLSWAEEFKPQGVFFACVLPGSVDTDMLKGSGFPPDMQPADIAKIVRFLLVEAPFAMTGSLVNAFG
jgi:NAD(P)-dependent dehydrogenase (short-subunit alcohol dehydrogenase family)